MLCRPHLQNSSTENTKANVFDMHDRMSFASPTSLLCLGCCLQTDTEWCTLDMTFLCTRSTPITVHVQPMAVFVWMLRNRTSGLLCFMLNRILRSTHNGVCVRNVNVYLCVCNVYLCVCRVWRNVNVYLCVCNVYLCVCRVWLFTLLSTFEIDQINFKL